ncbi:MAG TPA: hypothetical protein VG870_15360 [Chitinophagaceae bacterium]|nr:hypothetical protein [Chitinophagaceae bacterium]
MRWLLFFSRFALVCGLFFLLTVSLQMSNWTQSEAVSSTIIIIGYFLGLVFIPFVNLCYLVLLILNKKFWLIVPRWLIVVNALLLGGQLYYIFFLNE